MRTIIAVAALALAGPSIAQGQAKPFVVQESGEGFDRLQDAVSSIQMRTATILIAPGTYRDCAVQQGGRITFKAAVPGQVIFDGTPCEGKAALVLRGQASVVDGIVFRNLRVPDGNGSGIRIELGDLTVRNAMFLNSQEGILGGYDTEHAISIDRSTFSGLGQCDETPDCAHSIYINDYGSLSVTRSRFEAGRGGHYVKSRSRRTSVTDSSFDDTSGRKTNYMIDLSNGATGTISGNTFVQGRNKENWTGFIVVAAEGRTHSSAGLAIQNNIASLAPGETRSPAFVADFSGDRLAIGENRLGAGVRAFEKR